MHGLNKGVDTVAVRPISMGYGTVLPPPVRDGVRNAAANLGHPGDVVNYFLQGRPKMAMDTTLRFLVNSTVGIGGLFDVAGRIGLVRDDTDFGETLYRWGVAEGPYVELPLFGPRTGRATVGLAADFFLDPLFWILDDSPEQYVPTGANIASVIDARYRFRDNIDDVLYNSADSYARARIIYLQQRRFDLGGASESPYLDLDGSPEEQNAQITETPFINPYDE